MRFDHAGVATDDVETLAERYEALLDGTIAHEEVFEGLRVVFLDLGNGYIELLEPVQSDNAIAKYLDRQGSGIHHLAMATEDIAGALARAQRLGIELIDESPREGAWGHDVAFLHPRDTGGVLFEFVSTV